MEDEQQRNEAAHGGYYGVEGSVTCAEEDYHGCIKAALLSFRNTRGSRNSPIAAIFGFIYQELAIWVPST